MKNVTYISELCLPSNSGYAQHVLKICDSFFKKNLIQICLLFQTINLSKILKTIFIKEKF